MALQEPGKLALLVALLDLLEDPIFSFSGNDEGAKSSDEKRKQTVIMAPSNIAVDTVVVRLVKTEGKRQTTRRVGPKTSPTLGSQIEDIFLPSLCVGLNGLPDGAQHDQEIKEATILAGTVSACRFKANLPLHEVCTVVVDEAAQMFEAESCSAFNLAKDRVTLFGDHHQLPARIRQKELKRQGFDRSVLGRFATTGSNTAVLQMNYRSHGAIFAFPSGEYYKGLLVAAYPPSHFPRPEGVYCPDDERTIFRNVKGAECQTETGSWSNPEEAKVVIAFCIKLVRDNDWWKDKSDLQLKRMAVISPYSAQCSLISKGLAHVGLVCLTVDACQGIERDVIVVSGVRNNDRGAIGFMSEYRRLNVIITRARRLTIFFGHALTFYNAQDAWGSWSNFLDHLQGRKCVCDSAFNPIEKLKVSKFALCAASNSKTAPGAEAKVASRKRKASTMSGGGRVPVLNKSDREELEKLLDSECASLTSNDTFRIFLHEAAIRPQQWPGSVLQEAPLEARHRKFWSHFGRSISPCSGDDTGNPNLSVVCRIISAFMSPLPVTWRHTFPMRAEYQADIVETIFAFMDPEARESDAARKFFASYYADFDPDMVSILFSNLSNLVEIVRRLRLYSTLQDYNEEIIFGIKAMELPKVLEGAGEHPVDKFRKIMHTGTGDPGREQNSQASSSDSAGKPMRPPSKHEDDTRFGYQKKYRKCICDACGDLKEKQGWVLTFAGNYVRRTWPELCPSEMEEAWLKGLHDFTWLCIDCIRKSESLTDTEKTVALAVFRKAADRRNKQTAERNKKIPFQRKPG